MELISRLQVICGKKFKQRRAVLEDPSQNYLVFACIDLGAFSFLLSEIGMK